MKQTLLGLLIFLLVMGCESKPVESPSANVTFSDFDWRWQYSEPRIDLTHKAIFGNRSDYLAWAKETRAFFQKKFDSVFVPTPAVKLGTQVVTRSRFLIQNYVSPEGDSLLAIPKATDPTKPLIIAVHGHEIDHRGDAPWKLFDAWAGRFAADGYVVWAPSHLWYDRIGSKVNPKGSRTAEWDDEWHRGIGPVDYPIEWAKRISVLLDSTMSAFPPHRGLAVVGLSAGGLTASVLMAARHDIDVGVFAGSFTVLDFNREQYRIKGHPNNWDISWLNSYSTIFALIAPRATQWQLGRKDNFWPKPGKGVGTTNRRFPGFARAPMADETWGQFLILERIWQKFGAKPDFHIHDGGHIVDYKASRAFVENAKF